MASLRRVGLNTLLLSAALGLVVPSALAGDRTSTLPNSPARLCPGGQACAPAAQGAGSRATTADDFDAGENRTVVAMIVVIFGFLTIVWSLPYLIMRRRTGGGT